MTEKEKNASSRRGEDELLMFEAVERCRECGDGKWIYMKVSTHSPANDAGSTECFDSAFDTQMPCSCVTLKRSRSFSSNVSFLSSFAPLPFLPSSHFYSAPLFSSPSALLCSLPCDVTICCSAARSLSGQPVTDQQLMNDHKPY